MKNFAIMRGGWVTCICVLALLPPRLLCFDGLHNRSDETTSAVEASDADGSRAQEGGDAAELESLLHWAISHSDPDVLRQQALAASGAGGSKRSVQELRELADRRAKVREAIEAFSEEPTEAELITEAVGILNSYLSEWGNRKLDAVESSRSDAPQDGDHAFSAAVSMAESALQVLQVLCEPIDNANELGELGGLAPVVKLLSDVRSLRIGAASVIGVAAANNPTFQGELLEQYPSVFQALTSMLDNGDEDEAAKALHALAAVVRNVHAAQDIFRRSGGVTSVVELLGRSASAGRLKLASRSVQLLADLVVENQSFLTHLMQEGNIVSSVNALLRQSSSDLDILEKTLYALDVLASTPAARRAFHDNGTAEILKTIRAALQQEQQQMTDDDEAEFLHEVVNMLRSLTDQLSVHRDEL